MTPSNGAVPKNGAGIVRRAVRWMFLNRRTGRITVAQWPNIPLSAFILLSIALVSIRPSGRTEMVVRAASEVALLIWAVDEVVGGVNPFRRILGSVVLVATITNVAAGGL